MICNYFVPYCGLFFHSLVLDTKNNNNFDEVYLFYPSVSFTLEVVSETSLPNLTRSGSLFPSKIFMVLAPAFRSLIHFKEIFVYGLVFFFPFYGSIRYTFRLFGIFLLLKGALIAVKFLPSSGSAASHKFWHPVFLFSFVSRYFKFSLVIFFLWPVGF